MNLTAKDLIDFIVANKGKKTFVDCDLSQIAYLVAHGLQKDSIFYSTGLDGKIDGMILADRDDKKKVLFVIENLSMSLSTLKKFARMAKERWPDYTLEWIKNGKHKKHNTNKIYQKLSIL